MKLNPSQVEGYYNLGLIYEKYGDIDTAIKMYKKALSIRPEFSLAIIALKRLGEIE